MTEGGADYAAFAERLVAGGVLVDPYFEAKPRFATTPLLLEAAAWRRLQEAAEAVAAVYHELSVLCAREPRHADDFFALTPFQKLMWASSAPRWHGFARADLFETAAGLVCCELNCDTPTGQPEAVLLNAALATAAQSRATLDPNAALEASFCRMLEQVAQRALGPSFERTVGLVYPTDLCEDLPLIRLYQGWLTARGFDVVLGSPYNLTAHPSGAPALFGTPCPVILRHYKTDWWGERASVWTDELPFDDSEPLRGQLGLLFEAVLAERCVVVNPFGAVLPQNKRSMAFLWEHMDLFCQSSQESIRRLIPYTLRLEALHREQLSAERERWVLKSDYGCEGSEVVVGPACTQAEWEEAVRCAAPGRWIAQEYFRALESPAGESVNYGVYLVAGEAAGLYCRTHTGPTDAWAKSVPCFVSPPHEAGPR